MSLGEQAVWYYYWIKYYMVRKTNLGYCRQDFLDAVETNRQIAEMATSGMPFAVCRLGANESFTLRTYGFGKERNKKKALEQLCRCAGFFPPVERLAEDFTRLYTECMKEIDLFGTLKCPMDDYFIRKYLPKESRVTILDHIDSIGKPNPWTKVLEGKKVLIIHPFAKTIKSQYSKRRQLFRNPDILPEFELITYKAVQTSAGESDARFDTWFEALECMSHEIGRIDFDIALLGCGAYGLPLAVRIKCLGRQAVQIGGSLQLLFGVKGKRWDSDPDVSALYNEAWVYPAREETPTAAADVENACYWGGQDPI